MLVLGWGEEGSVDIQYLLGTMIVGNQNLGSDPQHARKIQVWEHMPVISATRIVGHRH